MSICIEQSNFKNNINSFSQNLSINDKAIAFPTTQTSKVSLLKQMKSWVANSRQRKDLAKLDERMLLDIGYTAEQARVECNKPFWK
ncbi:MAG: hypothetical protein ACI88H_004012 [Cocleimonas sp.]|jgi:uncharacterized protein YjiS (DUF1127 family)